MKSIFLQMTIVIYLFSKLQSEKICLHYTASLPCLFCSFPYYNPLNTTQELFEEMCIQKDENFHNLIVSRKILIVSQYDVSNYKLSNFDSIYHNLLDAFEKESILLSQYFSSELIIYLANETHFVDNLNKNILYFRRIAIILTIRPLYCNETIYTKICKNINDKQINIVIKSNFILYISVSLTIYDLSFDGSDFVLPETTNQINNDTITQCKHSLSTCCDNSFYENTFDEESNQKENLCGLKGRAINAIDKIFVGLINLEIIYDQYSNDIQVPILTIKNTSFINFLLINKTISSLISIQAIVAQINIENVLFINYFSVNGFIYVVNANDIVN